VVGRQDKTADAYEFFFESAKCMSKVVGVGLEWANVVVCMQCGSVNVVSISETAWQNSWNEVEEDVVVLSIDLANTRKEGRNIYSLTAEEHQRSLGLVYVHRALIMSMVEEMHFLLRRSEKMLHSIPSYGSWHITWLGIASNMQDLNLETVELALCGEFGDPQLALKPKHPHPISKLEMMLLVILGLLQICVMFSLMLQ